MTKAFIRKDVLVPTLRQMEVARAKYSEKHDDILGADHLVAEAHYRLGHMGELASPESVKADIITAIALLVHAIDTIDRTELT